MRVRVLHQVVGAQERLFLWLRITLVHPWILNDPASGLRAPLLYLSYNILLLIRPWKSLHMRSSWWVESAEELQLSHWGPHLPLIVTSWLVHCFLIVCATLSNPANPLSNLVGCELFYGLYFILMIGCYIWSLSCRLPSMVSANPIASLLILLSARLFLIIELAGRRPHHSWAWNCRLSLVLQLGEVLGLLIGLRRIHDADEKVFNRSHRCAAIGIAY